jgi:osmotically-inducible protein OsmY
MRTNTELQRDVMDALKWEPILNASEIGVSAKEGVVTLSGNVSSYSKKLAAERVTKKVTGVKAVAVDMEVRIGTEGKRTDTEIAQAVMNSLKWHTAVREDKIKAKVEDGWVTLEGEVEWKFQKDAAENAANNLMGVKGINNFISIKPKIEAKDIKNRIKTALQRSASLDAEHIEVEVDGPTVTLRGEVRSLAEEDDAAQAAWSAPGVTSVKDLLTVSAQEEIY